MAIRGALTHRKTRRLAKLLGYPVPCALGVMEALWHATAARCDTGNIGALSNQDIAEEMFWDGDADELIENLIHCAVIDRCDTHRLVTHGWAERADDYVHAGIARRREWFTDGTAPRLTRLNSSERATASAFYASAVPPDYSELRQGDSGSDGGGIGSAPEVAKVPYLAVPCQAKAMPCRSRTDSRASHDPPGTRQGESVAGPGGSGSGSDNQKPSKPPPGTDPPEIVFDGSDGADAATRARRFYFRVLQPLALTFHGSLMVPNRTEGEYLNALESLLGRGVIPSLAQLHAAMSDAAAYWETQAHGGRYCQSSGPVLTALAAQLNPAKAGPPGSRRNGRHPPSSDLAAQHTKVMREIYGPDWVPSRSQEASP